MDSLSIRPEVDQQKVREILASLKLPKEIQSVDTEFRLDHTGKPSVTLIFNVSPGVPVGKKDIARLSNFLSGVVTRMLSADIGGFPYTRLRQAS